MADVAIDKARTIGGSDVAGILGLSPFRTPMDVWREKVLGQRDSIDTPATRAGTRFEPHVLNAYRMRYLPGGAKLWTPEPWCRDHLRATPDAVAEVNGWPRLVEVKTTVLGAEWGDTDSDEVPLHYAVQALWYMDLLELDDADFPVLVWPWEKRDLLGMTAAEIVDAVELRVLKLRYSAALAREIRAKVDTFWRDHVLAESPPPAVDLADIRRLVHAVRGKTKPIDEDLVQALLERDIAKDLAKHAEAQVEAADFKVRAWLGSHEAAVDPRGNPLVTCKVVERAGYAVKPTAFRQLNVTKHWKELQKKP